MITPAQRAEIRRLSFGEHWKIGTIAAASASTMRRCAPRCSTKRAVSAAA